MATDEPTHRLRARSLEWPDREHELDRARWELAVAAAGIGSFDWDLTTGRLAWDERLIDLFGYERDGFDETIEAFNERLHPDDVDRVGEALQAAIDTCGAYGAEYRVVLPDGSLRWLEARGRALCDAQDRAVRVLGVAYDTTAVRDGEARVAGILESMTTAYFLLDPEWRFRYLNTKAERVLGSTRAELLGRVVWEAFPSAVGTNFEDNYRGAMATGETVTFEAYYPAPLDAWYEVRAVPAGGELSVYFVDVTSHRAALEAARRAAWREGLLARVTAELTQTRSADDAAARLVEVLLPDLADWCLISVVDDDSPGPAWKRLRDLGWGHVDPDQLPALERYAQLRMDALKEESFLARALATGEPILISDGATDAIAAVLQPGEAREVLRSLAPQTVGLVPLVTGGRTLGVLTLGHSEMPDQRQEASDWAVVQEVAARAALALDNARLYEADRRMAASLQRSLLTAPPEPDHAHITVRYEPAAAVAQVGGDWYDAFLQASGATVLVIGDVIGHDVEAAAAMGQVRGLLRGIAVTTGDGPASVLTRLDEAMELLQVGTTATAVVLRLEQTPEEEARGVTRLRWANAGHPPPLLIEPNGHVVVLGGASDGDFRASDLLLGIDPGTERTEWEFSVLRGSTVLMFTDGLIERRGESISEGLSRLRDVVAAVAHHALDDFCDEVLARMLTGTPEDDVALTAIRLHRQDRPRPASAGPNRVPPPLA